MSKDYHFIRPETGQPLFASDLKYYSEKLLKSLNCKNFCGQVQWTFLQISFTLAFRWRLMKDTKADPCVYQWKQHKIKIYCWPGVCQPNVVLW